jgi:hypothetical protein
VIVAVIAMRVVQMSIDQVIDVVAMRDRLVAAVGSVDVVGVVLSLVIRRAGIRVLLADRDYVLIDMIAMRMVQVPIVQVVHVPVVLDRGVATVLAVLMLVVVAGVGAVIVVHVQMLLRVQVQPAPTSRPNALTPRSAFRDRFSNPGGRTQISHVCFASSLENDYQNHPSMRTSPMHVKPISPLHGNCGGTHPTVNAPIQPMHDGCGGVHPTFEPKPDAKLGTDLLG